MKKTSLTILVTLALVASSFSASLLGAGATFPFPLYSKMFSAYNKQTATSVNYQAVGSGAGVRQLSAKTVDFGATDAFMTDAKIKKTGGAIIHIPTVLGAVVVTYNLPGNPTLNLTGEVTADIFLGKITQWNDSRIQKLNPRIKLPSTAIGVARRSDGSGTTFIFSDFLTKVSPAWQNTVGRGKSLKWPVGVGAKGNDGVAAYVKSTPGAIGYCELAYSIQNKMPQAAIKNQKGNYIKPTVAAISAAAAGEIPADTRITLTNTDAVKGYPIASFTWIIVFAEQNYNGRSKAQALETVKLIKWMITDAQKYATPLDYAPLSKGARAKGLAQLKKVLYNGTPLLK